MTDRPILFSAPMIRALLDGRKSQTRRILKPQPGPCEHKPYPSATDEFVPSIDEDGLHCATCGNGLGIANTQSGVRGIPVRFRKGDRLWVRENLWLYGRWRQEGATPKGRPRQTLDLIGKVAAFEKPADIAYWGGKAGFAFRPGIHMPRWASRLTLTVTDVRVQRLQECSETDALAEGIEQHGRFFGLPETDWDDAEPTAVGAYSRVWTQINGAGSWAANPFVVAVSFTVERRNIDAKEAA